MTLKTSFNRAFACLCTCAFFLFTCLFSSVSSVRALDVPSTGSATGDWATSQVVSAATTAVEGVVLSQFSELDPTTLAILEAELGFSYALGQDVWAMQNGIEDFTIDGKSVSVCTGVARVTIDGVSELVTINLTMSTDGCCFRGPYGIYGIARPGSGLSPWLSFENYPAVCYCYLHLTNNYQNYFTLFSGSFFDNPSPMETVRATNVECRFAWRPSGDVPSIDVNTWKYTSSSSFANAFLFLTAQSPLNVDITSGDVPTIMDAYKSALASQLGITVEDVDEVWTLPEEIPEQPTEPDGSGCCCQPFTLPSEWVQSDVVELETDHYTIPYDDMVDEPFDYLAGLGTYPNPPTPALNARKRSETSTVTRAVSVEEGSPPLVWDMADYETKTALTDYFLFAENLLHDTGLYNLVGSLIAVGIIVSLV